MAYCGKCGHQNNDDALFCGGCGAPLKKADDNRPDPPHWERIHLQREGAPGKEEGTAPRRESTPPRRERSGGVWGDMAERRRKAGQPEKQEPEKKKKKGSCLRRLLLWTVGIMVALVGALWLFAKYIDGDGGDGGEKDDQNPATFERIMSPAAVDSLVEARGFPKTTDDVAPLAGDYVGEAQGYIINIILKPKQDGKMVGKVVMKANGHPVVRDGVYCYCGNSIYATYKYDTHVERNKVQNYFYAMPDRKSIMMIDGGQYILKRKDPPPVHKGQGSGTLLSRAHTLCLSEAGLTSANEEHEYPIKDENNTIQYGTYTTQLEAKGEMHTLTYVFEPYEGENMLILAKVTAHADDDFSNIQKTFIGYCGHSIYAMYNCDEEDIEFEKKPLCLFYANSDGKSFSIFDKGKLFMEFKLAK